MIETNGVTFVMCPELSEGSSAKTSGIGRLLYWFFREPITPIYSNTYILI